MEPVLYLTVDQAFKLASSKEVHDSLYYYYGTTPELFEHPNWRYGLPPRYKGQELRIIDPFLHHLIPGKV